MRGGGLLALLALAGPVASGCLGLFRDENANDVVDPNAAGRGLVDDRTIELLDERLAAVPRNYTFPGQSLLMRLVHYVNGTVDQIANAGFEDRNDRSGNSYNVYRAMEDVSKLIPPGQPTEMHVTLYYANTAGNSVACDVAVDVPGTRTSFNTGNNDEFNWKFSVQRMIVNTVGVPGEKHEVGVECASGKMTQGSVPYTIRVDFDYERDVFTPFIPWAFTVPANATGVIIESAKAGGPEHLRSSFIVVGPDDDLVAYVDFNDIAIPTESVFIPTATPGEHVFYAFNMTGGFLRVKADAPVEMRQVRPLTIRVDRVTDKSGPAPGVVGRDWLHDGGIVTPAQGGEEVAFSADGTFPLRIEPFIGEGGAKTLMTGVRILSAKGLVASLDRVLRYDDENGSLGVTQDEFNRYFDATMLARGAYTVQVVNDSPDAAVGHVLTTYVR